MTRPDVITGPGQLTRAPFTVAYFRLSWSCGLDFAGRFSRLPGHRPAAESFPRRASEFRHKAGVVFEPEVEAPYRDRHARHPALRWR